MIRSISMILVLGLAVTACKKDKSDATPATKTTETTPAKPEGSPPGTAAGATADVGVEAGGIQHDAKQGPAAVVKMAKGTVEVRRVGETEFTAAKDETQLHAGDVIRTGEGGTATIALADESVIEVAEVTTVAIASREGSADPASGAAVLAGLARFTVTERAPGEGAFRVYTSAGVVLTKGTVYGVGVSASGEARVGVESGSVDVIGLAAVDAKPVTVDAGASVVLAANGDVASPSPWPTDDWGVWRDEADAKIEVTATLDAHAAAMNQLSVNLKDAYADLSATADSIATFEANAAVAAEKGDTATYQASLPDGAATIDASFSLAGRIELLTWAYASHARLATDLYVRHPAKLETQWTVIAPHVDAAILWPKRFEVTAVGYLEPLRMQYYVHHPRGRMHAQLVGISVPEFYAKVEAPQIDHERVRGRVKTKIWLAPEVRFGVTSRPVWVSMHSADWHSRFKLSPAPFRASAGWYVRPPTLKSNVLLGANATGKFTSNLKVKAPEPRANLRAAWSVPVGMKIKVGAPDLALAAKARGNIKLNSGGRLDANVRDYGGADMQGKATGKVGVKVPSVDIKGGVKAGADGAVKVGGDIKAGVKAGADGAAKIGSDIKAGAKAGIKATGDAAADAKAGIKAGADVKVKAPEVKVKAPEVKVKGEAKGEAKGKIKLGL